MERITISIETELAEAFDGLVDRHGYASRSEAIRDLVRGWISQEALRGENTPYCVAQIGFVYSRRDRTLAERLAAIQHDHHDLVVSSMLLHLDHDHCLETTFVRGATRSVRTFADRLIAQRGVRHGSISIIPVDVSDASHQHAPPEHGDGSGPHVHMKPLA
jgi:CopG family nickel-responsive transcriptional regulator